MKSRVVAAGAAVRRGRRCGARGECVRDRPLERLARQPARRAPRRASATAASSMPLGFATPCPAMSRRGAVRRPEDAGPGRREPARGDDPRPVPAGCRQLGDELGVLPAGVTTTQNRSGAFISCGQRLAQRQPLDADARVLLRLPVDEACSTSRPSPTAVTRARRERARSKAWRTTNGSTLVVERADDRDVAVRQPDTLDAPGQVELGLDALERGLPRERDEDRVGAARHAARVDGRQRMAVAADRLAGEGGVHLVDAGSRAGGLPRRARGSPPPSARGRCRPRSGRRPCSALSLHVAGTSSKTSKQGHGLALVGEPLEPGERRLQLVGGQLDARPRAHARANACRPECLPERQRHRQAELLRDR